MGRLPILSVLPGSPHTVGAVIPPLIVRIRNEYVRSPVPRRHLTKYFITTISIISRGTDIAGQLSLMG